MKKLNLLIILVFFCGLIFAQYPGSESLVHTQTGRVLDKGDFEVYTNMNFFTVLGQWKEGTSRAGDSPVNWWNVSANIALTFGLFDNFDVTLAPRVYQDLNFGRVDKESSIPDDIFMTLKAGSFAFANRMFYAAFMINMRLPTGVAHNIYFSEYASGAFEYGFMSALSYYADPYLPDRSFSAHINLGWYNHNEAGREIYHQYTSNVNSTELQYGFGILYPMDMFEFMLEVNGINYLQQPDSVVYGRENWMYIAPSVRYKPFSWLSLDLGIDYLLVGADDESSQNIEADLPNYSTWKVNMGLNFQILPLPTGADSPTEARRKQFNKRVDFFQSIIEERERVEDVQEELDRLKQDREEAEKELEELKQILEEQG